VIEKALKARIQGEKRKEKGAVVRGTKAVGAGGWGLCTRGY
jgi:hypothetical protein